MKIQNTENKKKILNTSTEKKILPAYKYLGIKMVSDLLKWTLTI